MKEFLTNKGACGNIPVKSVKEKWIFSRFSVNSMNKAVANCAFSDL